LHLLAKLLGVIIPMKDDLKSAPADANSLPAPVMTPREIVSELDRYIVGQRDAKRAVAIALRNRWRRQLVPDDLRDEIARIIMTVRRVSVRLRSHAAWPNWLRRLSSKSRLPNLLKSATLAATWSRSSAT
jgi:hypothetical protein